MDIKNNLLIMITQIVVQMETTGRCFNCMFQANEVTKQNRNPKETNSQLNN